MNPNKEKGEAYTLAWSKAYETAMQILHGGLLPGDIKLPTANEVALIIMNGCNLEWLESIRLCVLSEEDLQANVQHIHAHEWAAKNLRAIQHDKSKWTGQLDTK